MPTEDCWLSVECNPQTLPHNTSVLMLHRCFAYAISSAKEMHMETHKHLRKREEETTGVVLLLQHISRVLIFLQRIIARLKTFPSSDASSGFAAAKRHTHHIFIFRITKKDILAEKWMKSPPSYLNSHFRCLLFWIIAGVLLLFWIHYFKYIGLCQFSHLNSVFSFFLFSFFFH